MLTPGTFLRLSHAGTFTLWHYETDDEIPAVLQPGYFRDVGDMLARGDMIIVSSVLHHISLGVATIYVERLSNSQGPLTKLTTGATPLPHSHRHPPA